MKILLVFLGLGASLAFSETTKDSRGTWATSTSPSGVRVKVMISPSASESAVRAKNAATLPKVYLVCPTRTLKSGRVIRLACTTEKNLTDAEKGELTSDGFIVEPFQS